MSSDERTAGRPAQVPPPSRAQVLAAISEALQYGHYALAANLRRTYADVLAGAPPRVQPPPRPSDALARIWRRGLESRPAPGDEPAPTGEPPS